MPFPMWGPWTNSQQDDHIKALAFMAAAGSKDLTKSLCDCFCKDEKKTEESDFKKKVCDAFCKDESKDDKKKDDSCKCDKKCPHVRVCVN